MLECDMNLSTPESNMKYGLAALSQAQNQICTADHHDIIACYDMYHEARKLFRARAGLMLLKMATEIVDKSEGKKTPTPCKESQNLCLSVGWDKASGIGLFFSFLFSLLTSRRSDREEWWNFEALGHLDARNKTWAIEDVLWKARWVERAIEIAITLAAFSLGGLILGAASTLLAHKRYGWASVFTLLLSVLFWGSALEWGLFAVKAAISFLINTDEGFEFLRRVGHWRWKRQASKL